MLLSGEENSTLLLMAGLPGAGKTTLALALGRILHWPVIDKDTLKSTLLLAGIAEQTAGPTAYDLMFAMGQDLLVQQGLSVILDSPALYARGIKRASEMAEMASARFKVVLCLADSRVRARRMAERETRISQLTAMATSTEDDGRQHFLHLPADTLTLDTTRPLEELIPAVLSFLNNYPGSK